MSQDRGSVVERGMRSPIGALDINQRRIHRSLELTKRALGMEWEQLKSQAGGLRKLGRRLGKDEGDIRRVVMWVESLEWRQSWNHILGDLKQLHTRLGTAVVGQEGRGDCELISGVVFCISSVTMAWENLKLKISMVGTVPTRKLIHTQECLP
jgi:hypothetical protein